jgi:energy-coupling factor transport system ATP-binding protein
MTRPRPSSLIALAVAAALGFILLRVVYRAVFGGATTGETLLWVLPRLRLSGPFSHIVLFGPVKLEGLLTAVWSALPFAALILATGIVVAMVDLRSLVFLIPRITWGRATFVALVIALSTLPTLVESAKKTQYFAKVRGISKRRVLFVPFLENTLERAVGIAKALHARGVVVREEPVGLAEPEGIVRFEGFSIPSRGVSEISWTVPHPSLTLLTGETGVGKTSVLEALAWVLDYPHPVPIVGSVIGTGGPSTVGYVPHDPRSLFLAGSVVDEVALGLVMQGVSRREARNRAEQELAQWGLTHLRERHPGEISEGEAVLVGILSVLVLSPTLVLLDEPLAVLDSSRRSQVVCALAEYSRDSGATVLMTDHGHVSTSQWPGGFVQLGSKGITSGAFVPPTTEVPARNAVPRPEADVVFQVENLQSSKGQGLVLRGLDLEIRRGESVVVVGDNGVGKTTLLEELFERSDSDPSRIAYVPTNPAEMFVRETLAEELAFTDRELGLPDGFTNATLESLLPGQWRAEVVERAHLTHPRDLSRGQQTAVAIALQLSHKPAVLALDEPTRGLDSGAKAALAEVLACVQETGTAIISASHDDDFVAGRHDHLLRLVGGTLTPLEGGVLHA